VDGEPVSRIARQNLDVEERLEPFPRVCAAVEYAHRKAGRASRPEAGKHSGDGIETQRQAARQRLASLSR
jgi:hypothetical protein